MLRRRIVLLFDLILNSFYNIKGNLLDFKDGKDSNFSSVDGFRHGVLVSKVMIPVSPPSWLI